MTYSLDEDEEEKSDRDREDDHFQCETGDAEAAIDGVSPQGRERPSRAVRRRVSRSFRKNINVGLASSVEMATIRVACVLVDAASIHQATLIEIRPSVLRAE